MKRIFVLTALIVLFAAVWCIAEEEPSAVTKAVELMRNNESEKAVNLLNEQLKKVNTAEDELALHDLLGDIYYYNSQFGKAQAEYEAAYSKNPDKPYTQVKLAEILRIRADEPSIKRAISLYESAQDKGMQDPAIFYGLGFCYRSLAEMKNGTDQGNEYIKLAIDNFKNVLSMDPENYTVAGNLGDLYFIKGDYKDALELYQKLYSVGSDEPVVLARLGHTYAAMGQYEKSVEILRKAMVIIEKIKGTQGTQGTVVILATELDARIFLAEALKAMGKNDEADKELKAILTMPDKDVNGTFAIPVDEYKKRAQELIEKKGS